MALFCLLLLLFPIVLSLQLHQVSKTYPVTWQRRLFSSVPQRKFALHNVTLELNGLCLIQGASSSGKSTLLKVIEEEYPEKTAYLDIKPKPAYQDTRSVEDILSEHSTDLHEIFSLTGLPLDANMRQLTPSQLYELEIVKQIVQGSNILLLDEWLDIEPSSVLQLVQQSLWNLRNTVTTVVVTHYPERWNMYQITQCVTMAHGRVLKTKTNDDSTVVRS